MNAVSLSLPARRNFFLPAVWAVTVLVSLLPDILFRELGGGLPAWLFWAKAGLVAGLLAASLAWKALRPLWLFFTVLLAVSLLEWGVGEFFTSVSYKTWLLGSPSFVQDVGSVEIPRLVTALLMMLLMLLLTGSFSRFFFVKGNLNAPAKSIPWILTRPPSWRVLGPAIAAAMCLGLVVFVVVLGRPPALSSIGNVLPLLPFVLVFALVNSFGEEMIYRAPWLSALEGVVVPAQALLVTAAYFGLGHFYGVPYGVVGVLMAFIPGWLMGKSMLETRGFAWAWIIHFCMDATIFFFMALGSVTPGG